jgi:DNA-binding CsgD family transcriptional regulator
MFNTQIQISTSVYIFIFLFLIFFVTIQLVQVWNTLERKSYLYFLTFLYSGLIYNIVEGLLPDDKFRIPLLSQNIIAYLVGILVVSYYYYFFKKQYNIVFFEKVSPEMLFLVLLGSFIILFIIPYSIIQNLEVSRILFLLFIIISISLEVLKILKKLILKIKTEKNFLIQLHYVSSIGGLFGLISLPCTIAIFGDNQIIEQSFFSMGYFFIIIDFFLRFLRKKELIILLYLDILSPREIEIVNIISSKPNMRYAEICEKLNISEKTLSSHLSRIYKKTGLKNKRSIEQLSNLLQNLEA